MKNFKYLFFVMTFFFSLNAVSLQFPKKIQKKVDKEIRATFEVDTFSLKTIVVSEKINKDLVTKINSNNFYSIFQGTKCIGYAFVDRAPSKTAEFDDLVLFDKSLILARAKVLIYREDYGGEIASNRWLKQFQGASKKEQLVYEKDIIAISGATISANSMTRAINNLLRSITTLYKLNILSI